MGADGRQTRNDLRSCRTSIEQIQIPAGQLLYSQYGGNGTNVGGTIIEMMSADGSGKQSLFHKEGTSAFDAVWSPAGDMIAFRAGKYFRAAGTSSAQIALMSLTVPDTARSPKRV